MFKAFCLFQHKGIEQKDNFERKIRALLLVCCEGGARRKVKWQSVLVKNKGDENTDVVKVMLCIIKVLQFVTKKYDWVA